MWDIFRYCIRLIWVYLCFLNFEFCKKFFSDILSFLLNQEIVLDFIVERVFFGTWF